VTAIPTNSAVSTAENDGICHLDKPPPWPTEANVSRHYKDAPILGYHHGCSVLFSHNSSCLLYYPFVNRFYGLTVPYTWEIFEQLKIILIGPNHNNLLYTLDKDVTFYSSTHDILSESHHLLRKDCEDFVLLVR
jgi:hypothetical protein